MENSSTQPNLTNIAIPTSTMLELPENRVVTRARLRVVRTTKKTFECKIIIAVVDPEAGPVTSPPGDVVIPRRFPLRHYVEALVKSIQEIGTVDDHKALVESLIQDVERSR